MQQLASLSLTLAAPSGSNLGAYRDGSLGPFLQGALFEHLDSDYVAWLHAQPFNPYSQYCVSAAREDCFVWRINALTEEAAQQIVMPMVGIDQVELRSAGVTFEVDDASLERIELRDLTDLIQNDTSNRSVIKFLTPTSFKQAGRYAFIPNERLILQNLLMRFSQVYDGDKEVDTETIKYLQQNVSMTTYDLWSKYFSNVSHKQKIPAFTGSLVLRGRGNQPLIGLVRMLLKFSEFSGIGIKTSMGMGGVQCI